MITVSSEARERGMKDIAPQLNEAINKANLSTFKEDIDTIIMQAMLRKLAQFGLELVELSFELAKLHEPDKDESEAYV
jgi:hypothetical protein